MNNHTTDASLRRILVALDSSLEGVARIEAAAALAARCGAELLGLFVEDVDLLHLAGLPFAHEIAHTTASRRALDSVTMERSLRAQAEEMRRNLESSAARAHITWSFRIARGHVVPELLALASEIDLMIVGDLVQVYRPGRAPAAAMLRVLMEASCSVLVHRHYQSGTQPVAVFLDNAAHGDKLLAIGAQLSLAGNRGLLILIPPNGGEVQTIAAETLAGLARRGIRARIVSLGNTHIGSLIHAIQAENAGALVLAASSPMLYAPRDAALLTEIKCGVVVVR
jgi:nucleotide-binding universal stress UspA family protein